MSINRANDDKFIRPTAEDNENFESFSFPMITILSNWKTLFYSKDRKIALMRMITPKIFASKAKSAKKGMNDDFLSDVAVSAVSNRITPIDNNLSHQTYKGSADKSGKTPSFIEENNHQELEVPKEDEEIAKEFLNRFLLNDEGSAHSMINLVLFFKSLPSRIKEDKLKRAKFFNFKLFQESLVAYMNTEDVNAFEYHDEKNRDRVALVRNQLNKQKKNLATVKEALSSLEVIMENGAKKLGKDFDLEDKHQKEEQQKLTGAVTNF
jgi:hypothetical protein